MNEMKVSLLLEDMERYGGRPTWSEQGHGVIVCRARYIEILVDIM